MSHNRWREDSSANYEFRIIDQNGLHIRNHCSLEEALREKSWNVISFDKAPLSVTDTIMSMDIASKIAILFDAVNMSKEAE